MKCSVEFKVSKKQAFPVWKKVDISCPNCKVDYTHNHWPPIIAGLVGGIVAAELKKMGTEYLHLFSFPVSFSLIWILLVARWPLKRKSHNT